MTVTTTSYGIYNYLFLVLMTALDSQRRPHINCPIERNQ